MSARAKAWAGTRAGAWARTRNETSAGRPPRLPLVLPLGLLLVLLTVGLPRAVAAQTAAPEIPPSAPDLQARPAWAVEGVPDTVRVLVEASMAATDDDRTKRLLREAETLARAAAEERPGDVPRRFALAVVLGLRADREGGKTKVGAASALHEELLVILELDPEHARARHMLGRLHAGVRRMNSVVRWIATRLLGGEVLARASWEEAERHLVFAEERAPEVSDHHLQLANLYRDTGRPELALREIVHVLALPARSPMEHAVREEAEALRRTLEQGGEP